MPKYKAGDMMYDRSVNVFPKNEEYVILVRRKNAISWEIWSTCSDNMDYLTDRELEQYYAKL